MTTRMKILQSWKYCSYPPSLYGIRNTEYCSCPPSLYYPNFYHIWRIIIVGCRRVCNKRRFFTCLLVMAQSNLFVTNFEMLLNGETQAHYEVHFAMISIFILGNVRCIWGSKLSVLLTSDIRLLDLIVCLIYNMFVPPFDK